MSRNVLLFACLWAGCAEADPPVQRTPVIEVHGQPAWIGSAGWDGVVLPEVRETTFAWGVDPERDSNDERWIPIRTVVDEARLEWMAESADGDVVSLTAWQWPEYGWEVPHRPDRALTAGEWQAVALVDGEPAFRQPHVVSEHGQTTLDPASVHGALFDLPQGIGTLWPPTIGGLLDDVATPMQLRLEHDADGTFATLFAPGKAGVCRVWSGDITVDDRGRFTAELPQVTLTSGEPVTFTDVRLEFGVHPDGQSLAGVQLDASLDTRDFDPVVTAHSEPVVEGAAAEWLRSIEVHPRTCQGGGDYCLTIHTVGGTGERVDEAVWLTSDPATAHWDSIYDAPPCGGPEPSAFALSCSTVGTAAVGTWFVGLGALLFRRRRRQPAPPA